MTADEDRDDSSGPLEEQTQAIATGSSSRQRSSETATNEPPVSSQEAETVVDAGPLDEPVPPPTPPVKTSLDPLLLERIEPSFGRGEKRRLDTSCVRLRLGRSEDNDLRLYTASASREHAVIEANEVGEWVITPLGGNSFRIDGDEMRESVVLELGMNVVMGGDHLRCVPEDVLQGVVRGVVRGERLAQADVSEHAGSPAQWARWMAGMTPLWWMIAAAAMLGVGLILLALLDS